MYYRDQIQVLAFDFEEECFLHEYSRFLENELYHSRSYHNAQDETAKHIHHMQ